MYIGFLDTGKNILGFYSTHTHSQCFHPAWCFPGLPWGLCNISGGSVYSQILSDILIYPPLRSKPGAGQWDIKPQEGKASGSGSRITHFTSQFLNSPCPRVRSRWRGATDRETVQWIPCKKAGKSVNRDPML